MVGHIVREQTDMFLEEITRHAPWETWAEKLSTRKRPEPLHKLITSTEDCPLMWSTTGETSERARELLEWLFHLRRRRHKDESPSDWTLVISEWLEACQSPNLPLDRALEAVAWAHALPRLAVRALPEVWSALFAHLVNLSLDATAAAHDLMEPEAVAVTALLSGELPLTLAYIFPKIEVCQQLTTMARQTLENGMVALLDGEGMLQARYVKYWRGLLACWTRCFYLDRKLNGDRISKDARLQFEWLVRQSIRWSRGDGTFVLADDASTAPGLIEAALAVAGDRVDRDLFAVHQGRLKADDSEFDLPLAGESSEWGELAILRTDWSAKASYLGVTHAGTECATELAVQGTLVWSGPLTASVRVDGINLAAASSWEQVCWSSDNDVDYLELQLELTHGWQLQRQFLLAREEGFLWLADALIGPHNGQVEYRLELPLNSQIQCVPEKENTEIQLLAPRSLGWAIPAGLSEWRTERRLGQFDGQVLFQTDNGSALYAPLFFDLDPARRRKPRTWRQLTVAEQLEIMPRDVAVAYRVQVGNQQWVFYRSLGPCGNRTFIGQNIISEFLAARLTRAGETETLIELEHDSDA